ncbi:hypothetical protein O6H91_17G022200 [Diphasiastrum complanatum]|uniref:Uncharacterized protein n=1 Tax=Diphasiastrum complanatum TaxID=34168 RepID=A0ACC2B5T7_DIPCM|nr:hypothetical protein O6H91_17G022200 [Diphasiastrum complanatum]
MNAIKDADLQVTTSIIAHDTIPDHLLVLVHGILASSSDWKYVERELKKHLGIKYLIYVSSINTYLHTLNGVDVGGRRLADEIYQVVEKNKSLKKISFLCHSLGGLFARYAIALLFKEEVKARYKSQGHLKSTGMTSGQVCTVAGLEPVNFITLATPHLGVRGKKQLPFLLGVPVLEKIAVPLAPLIVGRTGRQLFLMDGKASDPPLLLRMVSDCEEGRFLSALGSFQLRVVYANVSYDHWVGWRTSSIRRETELPKPPRHSLKGYKHVMSVVDYPAVPTKSPSFQKNAAEAKEAAQTDPSSKKAVEYHEILEEEIVKGLQQISWRKVDISFHSALWPYLAHNHIHVKQEWLYYEGAGVVTHVADTLKQQEKLPFLEASL